MFRHFKDGPNEIAAACLSRAAAHVRVDLPPKSVGRKQLLENEFLATPSSIDFCIALPLNVKQRSHNWRKSLKHSLEKWDAQGLELSIRPARDVSHQEIVDDLYYPVLVREFYARGISPYGAHNLDTFLQLLKQNPFVCEVHQNGRVVGGGLIKKHHPLRQKYSLKGQLLEGSAVEGMIYALRSDLNNCKRAFWYKLASAFSDQGYDTLSLGRDLPWFDTAYAPIILEKMRWADEVSACVGRTDVFLSINAQLLQSNRGLIVCELLDGGVTIRSYGAASEGVIKRLQEQLS